MSCANNRCKYSQYCRVKTHAFIDPWDEPCPEYEKLDELAMDAEADRQCRQDEDEIPFCEDYDGPEEEADD